MRILLVGQAAFAEEVLRGLEAAGDTIAAVVCPPDAGPKPDPVKGAALARGIPVHQFRSLKAPEAQHALAEARADLGVLAYATQIVPEPLLHVPRLTSICFHPSLLPRYRGGSAIAWQLIRGETESGVTVFWPDAGIDTGPILLQRPAPVGPDDTAGSLYYRTLCPPAALRAPPGGGARRRPARHRGRDRGRRHQGRRARRCRPLRPCPQRRREGSRRGRGPLLRSRTRCPPGMRRRDRRGDS